MSIALDIICAVIFLWAVIASWRKGFIKSILGLASVIAAFVVSKKYTPDFALWIDKNFMNGKVGELLDSFASSNKDVSSMIESVTSLFESMKQIVPSSEFGMSGTTAAESIKTAMDSFTAALSYSLSEIAAFILLFIATFIVCKIVIFFIDLIFKLPVLDTINKGFGFLFGIIKGLLFIFVVCLLVSFVMMMTSANANPLITAEIIEDTYVFRHFYYNNIVAGFLF